MTAARPLALAAACALLAACTSLATRIAEPRTETPQAGASLAIERNYGFARRDLVARGGNRIAYWSVPAADYHVAATAARTASGLRFSFTTGAATPVATRGTVVFLHGWSLDHGAMLPWALALAGAGYQGVLPDLRNHGASTRAPAGYGTREADDIVALIAALHADGRLQPPLYLVGVSYGAATAVRVAASPDVAVPVRAVVAMEPMLDVGDAIRGLVRNAITVPEPGGIARASQAWMRRHYDAARIDAAIAQAGKRLALDLDTLSIAPLLRADTLPCTLLLQGGRDGFFAPAAAAAFSDAPNVRYAEVADEGHLTLPVRVDLLAAPLVDWLQASTACPRWHGTGGGPAGPAGPGR